LRSLLGRTPRAHAAASAVVLLLVAACSGSGSSASPKSPSLHDVNARSQGHEAALEGSSPAHSTTMTPRQAQQCADVQRPYLADPNDSLRATAVRFVAACRAIPPPILTGALSADEVNGLNADDVFFTLALPGVADLSALSCDCKATLAAAARVMCGELRYGWPYDVVVRGVRVVRSAHFDPDTVGVAAITAYCPEQLAQVPDDVALEPSGDIVALMPGLHVPEPTTLFIDLVRGAHPGYDDVSDADLADVADYTCEAMGEQVGGDVRTYAYAAGFSAKDSSAVTMYAISIQCPELMPAFARQMHRLYPDAA
jgi:hypothetical protein